MLLTAVRPLSRFSPYLVMLLFLAWFYWLGPKATGMDDPPYIEIRHAEGRVTTLRCADPTHGVITCPQDQLVLDRSSR